MSGHYPFRELTKDFSPERRARIAALKAEMLAAMEPAQTSESPQKPPARPAAPAEGAAPGRNPISPPSRWIWRRLPSPLPPDSPLSFSSKWEGRAARGRARDF